MGQWPRFGQFKIGLPGVQMAKKPKLALTLIGNTRIDLEAVQK
jgi:hypothetical protein